MVCIRDIPAGAGPMEAQHFEDKWDFRLAHREQPLQRQLDRLRAASRGAGALWHTGVRSGTSGSEREGGFLINAVLRLLQADRSSPCSAPHSQS